MDMREKVKEVENERKKLRQVARPESIERQHARGKLTAHERMDLFFDPGTLTELNAWAKPRPVDSTPCPASPAILKVISLSVMHSSRLVGWIRLSLLERQAASPSSRVVRRVDHSRPYHFLGVLRVRRPPNRWPRSQDGTVHSKCSTTHWEAWPWQRRSLAPA